MSDQKMGPKLWGGAFYCGTHDIADKLNYTIQNDKFLYKQEIQVSLAYCEALHDINILTSEELIQVQQGYSTILKEWEENQFIIENTDEDIYTANERRLVELIGPTGSKIGTGKSRDSHSSTVLRLWLREEIKELILMYKKTILNVVKRAEDDKDLVMPGHTHNQLAEPIRYSHLLLSYGFKFQQDIERIEQVLKHINQFPLGGGGYAGINYNIDLNKLAKQLEFDGIIKNSINAVADRTFIMEFLFWASITGLNFSQLSEEMLKLDCYGYIHPNPVHETGSSYYAHQSHANCLEVLRSKAGIIFGKLTGFMMTSKSLSNGPNKDFNEANQLIFDTVNILKQCIPMVGQFIRLLTVDNISMKQKLNEALLCNEAIKYLVLKEVPYRQAHHIIGKIKSQVPIKSNSSMFKLPMKVLTQFSNKFDEDFQQLHEKYEDAVNNCNNIGGTSLDSINKQIEELKQWLNITEEEFSNS
ncbi:L-Aspartase-like protein [Neoconidiobolus thromboides FSU 785]|nr:L-Aspartase-like protein [Neoconidiobolus thromboides FSU 785]